MNNFPKISGNYNFDLPKVSEGTEADHFKLPKIRKMAEVICPRLVKMTITLLNLIKTQRLNFMTEKTIINASKIASYLLILCYQCF